MIPLADIAVPQPSGPRHAETDAAPPLGPDPYLVPWGAGGLLLGLVLLAGLVLAKRRAR